MSRPARGVVPLDRLARQAERRIRWVRSLRLVTVSLCGALLLAIAALGLRKVGVIGEGPTRAFLLAAGVAVAILGAVAWAWPLPAMAGARALDRHHGLHDRLANALAFAAQPASERTAFMAAAIEDAVEAAQRARPREAVPFELPRALGWAAGLVAAFVTMTMFEVRQRTLAVHAKTLEGVEMAPDDLQDVRDFLRQLDARDPSADAKAAIEEFNRLIEDIANRRLDRTEAFRRLAALEEKLLTGSAADRSALEKQLEAMGDELKKADLTRPAGAALSDNQLAKARDALHELAKKLRAPDAPVDNAKLEAVRDALKKAADGARQRQAAIERRREELADEILKAKKRQSENDAGSDEERSLLEKKQQELERLDRELAASRSARQELDRLDRELQQTAEDLMKDLGLGAQDLDQGAEDLNRMQEQQMSQQEKEELRQKLQELRQLLRQQSQPGQGGPSQLIRLKRFGQMARGQNQGGSGQSGGSDSRDGSGTAGGAGTAGQGPSGSPGQGQGGSNGQGAGANGSAGGGETWIVGPNGEKLLMLSKGPGGGAAGDGQGADRNGPGTPGRWGEGHDPKVQGNATHPKMGTEDTQVQSADTGQGGSRSQVILGAAERGFASRKYQRVYTEYHQVAEESLAKDDIPGGYRFYVKRYFQLIRPRDTP